MAPRTNEALCQMKLTTLASLCIDEIKQRGCPETSDGRYCLELLRRATVEQTDQAWSLLQQCFSEIIRAWIRSHPSCDVALLYDSEENLIAKIFSRFRYAVHEDHLEFRKLSGALCYLRATVSTILTDTIRSSSRMQVGEVSLPEQGDHAELTAEEPMDSQNIWESIESMLVDERERRIAYLLYFCGLKPREIVLRCTQEFDDVKEIYRLHHNIVERLRYILDSDG